MSLLRAPLLFGAARTRLVFDAKASSDRLDGGNPELARHNDAIALQYLSQIERDNIEVRVREVLTQRLAHGEPSQEDVAEILNMSARTLQRKLGECGTTYKEILDDTRRVAGAGLPERAAAQGQRRDLSAGIFRGQLLYPRISPLDGPIAVRLARGRAPTPSSSALGSVPSEVSNSLASAMSRGRTFSSKNSFDTM